MRADKMVNQDAILDVPALSSESCNDTQRFGGKACNLQRLHQNGFKIPAGFVLPCSFYSRFIQENPKLHGWIQQLDGVKDLEALMHITAKVEDSLVSCDIPDEIEHKIKGAYRDLTQKRKTTSPGFAVRSSATLEDGSEFSFAGQAESYLGVNDFDDVMQSIKRVWCSALSTRSVIYLSSNDIPLTKMKMAVIVQELIPADVSGVMFTANVVTNDLNEMLIDGTYGLGATIVSGKVIPDSYVMQRNPLKILEKRLGKKESMVRPHISNQGVTIHEETTPREMQESFAMQDNDVLRVARLGEQIESAFGCPQDIEWCIHRGKPIVLQSRPITTLR